MLIDKTFSTDGRAPQHSTKTRLKYETQQHAQGICLICVKRLVWMKIFVHILSYV